MKSKLRTNFLEKRNNVSPDMKKKYDEVIFSNFFTLDIVKHAETFFGYNALNTEAGTYLIMKRLLEMGKKLALPRVILSKKTLIWHYVLDLEKDVVPGAYGILEPGENLPEAHALKEGIVLVPGVAFDRYGNRIGFGAGYYDKFLSENEELIKIGLCYSVQISEEEIPVEDHDVSMNIIVAEDEIIYI